MSRIKQDKTGKFAKHDPPNLCKIEGCGRPVRGHGFCNRHMLRFMRYGDPHFRKKAANGEGGYCNGYRSIYVNGKRVYEHRHIMETHLGRKLRDDEIIHHLDGNKLNNSIENLAVVSRKAHVNHHPESLANLPLGPKVRWGTKS